MGLMERDQASWPTHRATEADKEIDRLCSWEGVSFRFFRSRWIR